MTIERPPKEKIVTEYLIRPQEITRALGFAFDVHGFEAELIVSSDFPLTIFAGIDAVVVVHDPTTLSQLERDLGELEPEIATSLQGKGEPWSYTTRNKLKERGIGTIIYQPVCVTEGNPATTEQIEEAYWQAFKTAHARGCQSLVMPFLVPVEVFQRQTPEPDAIAYQTVIPAYQRFLQGHVFGLGPASGPFPGKSPHKIYLIA